VRLFGFRASGDKGQNGAPAGKYPMRLENYYGYNWMLAGVNANNDDNVNHFGIYQADGTTELLYVDNLGKVRMVYPSTSGTSTDNVLVIGTDGLIKQISQTKLSGGSKEAQLLFVAPVNTAPDVYFKRATQITSVLLRGASSFAYSINNGASYITPVLPLLAATVIKIDPGTWVRFRIAFTTNTSNATTFLEFSQP
jgi:hypothetical protein